MCRRVLGRRPYREVARPLEGFAPGGGRARRRSQHRRRVQRAIVMQRPPRGGAAPVRRALPRDDISSDTDEDDAQPPARAPKPSSSRGARVGASPSGRGSWGGREPSGGRAPSAGGARRGEVGGGWRAAPDGSEGSSFGSSSDSDSAAKAKPSQVASPRPPVPHLALPPPRWCGTTPVGSAECGAYPPAHRRPLQCAGARVEGAGAGAARGAGTRHWGGHGAQGCMGRGQR